MSLQSARLLHLPGSRPPSALFSSSTTNARPGGNVSTGMNAVTLPPVATPCEVAQLPDDPVVLKRLLEEVLALLQRRDHDLQQVQTRLDQLLRRLYGPRRERFDPNELLLFPEMAEAAATSRTPPPAETPPKRRRHQHGRQRPAAHLPRQQRVYELSEAQRACPCCGQLRQVIGREVTEQYDCVPQSVYIIEHVRHKYACPDCEQRRQQAATPASATTSAEATAPGVAAVAAEGRNATATPSPSAGTPLPEASAGGPGTPQATTLVTAPLPLQGVPRCLAAPGLLAQVIVSKFGDHLPLYRQAQQFARQGVPLSRSTLCDWLKRSADLVTPLCHSMAQEVLRSRVVQSDDTHVGVLDAQRDATRQARLWVYCGDDAHPHTVYAYSPNREGRWPQTFLQNYRGYLQADAYSGYDGLFAAGQIVEVGCWAHARRKFFDAQTTEPLRASYVLAVIRELYAVEKQAAEEIVRLRMSGEAADALRLQRRQEQSAPQLTALRHWLEQERAQVLPKSPLGEAIGYALNQWQALLEYTTRGFLAIDNNAAERALRAVAVGRKNYLFFGSDVGGETAAVLYSLVQTCKRLGIEPWRYLRDVLERLPTCSADQWVELLPDRWAAAQRAAAVAASVSAGDTS
jgi:transposase